ncbi:hypothetical protein ABZ614_10325 [Streptomyces sp. NPDC013178]|uniref:hypothetical protein n=1 Tax=unclassified Streptomyces TaxID=2593676 RepID=UPI0033D0BFED
MRRTTDPGSPALTFASLPKRPWARSLPLKHFEQYSSDYTDGKKPKDTQEAARGKRAEKAREVLLNGEKMAEKMAKKRYGRVQFGHVHVHLPLHLLSASETMVARHRCIATTANPGSASHGDEWIDHARAVTAGPSAA